MRDGAVMVTGGAGYIGSHAVLALLDAGHRVVVVDNLDRVRLGGRSARHVGRGRRRGRRAVRGVIRDHGVNAIMHFAGSVVVPESVSDPLKYYRNNTVASRALIESAVVGGRPAFHLLLDRRDLWHARALPVAEGDPTVPINPYGMSKLMTEAMLRDVAARTRSTIARCAISTSPAPTRRGAAANRPWARRT